MAYVMRCDRCGIICEGDVFRFEVTKRQHGLFLESKVISKDLCPKCKDKLMLWTEKDKAARATADILKQQDATKSSETVFGIPDLTIDEKLDRAMSFINSHEGRIKAAEPGTMLSTIGTLHAAYENVMAGTPCYGRNSDYLNCARNQIIDVMYYLTARYSMLFEPDLQVTLE